jgi:hypothetical protein
MPAYLSEHAQEPLAQYGKIGRLRRDGRRGRRRWNSGGTDRGQDDIARAH